MKAVNKFALLFLLCLHGRGGSGTLLVAHNHEILRLELGNKTKDVVVSADWPVIAFDIHQAWAHVYWATSNAIFRTPLYDTHTTTLIAVVGKVGGVTVDWIHHQLYWTDILYSRIETARLDGKGRRVVYEGNALAGAVTLDPELGCLFWIESIQDGRNLTSVMSLKLDGSIVNVLYTDENIDNSPLALDVVYKSVYFYKTNGRRSEQWEINYDGIEPRIKLFERDEAPASSLSLGKGGFYYSNNDGLFSGTWVKTSYTLVYGNRTDRFVLLDPYFKLEDATLGNAVGIRVWNETAQPRLRDACLNHHCDHQCVPDGLRAVCVCNYGFTLGADSRSCVENGYILYSTSKTFGRITYDGEQQTTLYNDSSANIEAFDVHVKAGYIYWSNIVNEAIYRAPIETPHREEVVVQHVSAYGVAVDWVHDHIYWSEHSKIMVASLDGVVKMALLEDLDAPAAVAVDPVNRFVFWSECGSSLSVKRSALDGSHKISVLRNIRCGTTLVLDPVSTTLYWLDWVGTVYSASYSGANVTLRYPEWVRAMAITDSGLLLKPWDEAALEALLWDVRPSPYVLLKKNLKPSLMKVIKNMKAQTLLDFEDTDCPGLCLPSSNTTLPCRCFCPNRKNSATPCSINDVNSRMYEEKKPEAYLELVNVTSFSVTLQCAGRLLTHPVLQPYIHVEEVDSMVLRNNVTKDSFVVKVADKSMPFTVDSLNPATSYRISVRNRVTRASFSLMVHTPPPPLAVQRLPTVTVPGIEGPVLWLQQGVHYFRPNPWDDLVHKEYVLLLISEQKHTQPHSPVIEQQVLEMIERKVKDNFLIIRHYKTKEEFDDDPEMYLGNIPWGEEFRLAMVQATEYKGRYNLDFVYSQRFALPDPYWRPFFEKLLDDQE